MNETSMTSPPEATTENKKALLLLHLLLTDGRRLTKGDANKKITDSQKRLLNLTTGAANQLREEMVHAGYLTKSKETRTVAYELTERGLALLIELRQYPGIEFNKLTGQHLNLLLDAVGTLRTQWEEPGAAEAVVPPEPQAGAVPADLDQAILAEFSELLRERHGHTGMVPVHEVRWRISEKFGSQVGRHDVFDPAVKRLRQEGKLELVPISDLREATVEQLNDSIPGVNETLFYLEPAHEQAIFS